MQSDSVDPIYLDHNATTPVHPEVVEAMLPYLRDHFGNPSSGHVYGQRARTAVERAREAVAALIRCAAHEIVFTSGGTESNNLAIVGTLALSRKKRHIVTTVVEHPATTNPCKRLAREGCEVTWAGVDGNGMVDVANLAAAMRNETALVTIMRANNETGTVQPVASLAASAHREGAVVHTDAAQAVGKIPVDVDQLDVDLLSIAGHKLYAPKGIGALYVRRGVSLSPVLLGGGQEKGLSPGTENIPHIVALGRAAELAAWHLEDEARRQRQLTRDLLTRLQEAIPGLRLNGHPEARLPNTLNVSFPRVRGSEVLACAPGIAASTGSACHEGAETPSNVLTSMGLSHADAMGAVRLSTGRFTRAGDVEKAAGLLIEAWRKAAAG